MSHVTWAFKSLLQQFTSWYTPPPQHRYLWQVIHRWSLRISSNSSCNFSSSHLSMNLGTFNSLFSSSLEEDKEDVSSWSKVNWLVSGSLNTSSKLSTIGGSIPCWCCTKISFLGYPILDLLFLWYTSLVWPHVYNVFLSPHTFWKERGSYENEITV